MFLDIIFLQWFALHNGKKFSEVILEQAKIKLLTINNVSSVITFTSNQIINTCFYEYTNAFCIMFNKTYISL